METYRDILKRKIVVSLLTWLTIMGPFLVLYSLAIWALSIYILRVPVEWDWLPYLVTFQLGWLVRDLAAARDTARRAAMV